MKTAVSIPLRLTAQGNADQQKSYGVLYRSACTWKSSKQQVPENQSFFRFELYRAGISPQVLEIEQTLGERSISGLGIPCVSDLSGLIEPRILVSGAWSLRNLRA